VISYKQANHDEEFKMSDRSHDQGNVAYILFDVESIADGQLVSQVRYPGENLTPAEAVQRYQDELVAKSGSSFVPYTHQLPVSIIVGKVDSQFRLMDIVALDEPKYRSHVMTENFWRGWEAYQRPTLVSFNGRGFDIPLLELAAYRYGISIPHWFDSSRGFSQPRNRYNTNSHLDLQEVLVNFGATRFNGGLNLAATLLGKPGKMDVQGDMVQQMHDEGKLEEINDYCRCDVLDTYFVFLRYLVLTGHLQVDKEQQLVSETKEWLIGQADDRAAYATYLDHWSDWNSPWKSDPADDEAVAVDDPSTADQQQEPVEQDA
jgi:predicted PolB exonuclease-like 3'-5' exonuclease